MTTKKDAPEAGADQSTVTESKGSSPNIGTKAHTADEKAAVGQTFKLRNEKPTEPAGNIPAFPQIDVSKTSVGNPDFVAELKDEGKLGLFLTRDRARRKATPVTLNVTNYFTGIMHTIHESMIHLFQSKTEFNDLDLENRVEAISEQLAIGACIATYLKLRALIFIEFPDRYSATYIKRPKVITDLPVVAPFAFAIQQLGAVNIANLTHEARYVPILPTTGHRFGIPTGRFWNPNAYAQAVEYARKFGLHFNVIDHTQKSGTAWWLLRQHFSEDIFELKLPFPEVNYTSAMALTHSLFLMKADNATVNPSNAIFDLTPCGTHDYGYILRDPHFGINVTTFETIDESAKEIAANV